MNMLVDPWIWVCVSRRGQVAAPPSNHRSNAGRSRGAVVAPIRRAAHVRERRSRLANLRLPGAASPNESIAPAKLEYRRQEVGNLCPNHREERLIVTHRVGNIRRSVRRESRPKRCEVCDISCVALRCEAGGFAQCERLVELLRGKFQDVVALCPRHSKDKIRICGNRWRELSCGKVGCITTQLLEDACSVGLNRMPNHRGGTRT